MRDTEKELTDQLVQNVLSDPQASDAAKLTALIARNLLSVVEEVGQHERRLANIEQELGFLRFHS
jgi:hypothetical protein